VRLDQKMNPEYRLTPLQKFCTFAALTAASENPGFGISILYPAK